MESSWVGKINKKKSTKKKEGSGIMVFRNGIMFCHYSVPRSQQWGLHFKAMVMVPSSWDHFNNQSVGNCGLTYSHRKRDSLLLLFVPEIKRKWWYKRLKKSMFRGGAPSLKKMIWRLILMLNLFEGRMCLTFRPRGAVSPWLPLSPGKIFMLGSTTAGNP